MNIYRLLSALLSYPDADLQAAVPELRAALAAHALAEEMLEPLLQELASQDLISLQENYVATFDRSPALAMHLFEHIHGESRDRGQAMVDLLEEYKRYGFEPLTSELPDYVPLFLEFLSLIDADVAEKMLGDAIHVIAAIGVRLQKRSSPYANAFLLLTAYTEVTPRETGEPPVRDMDEAMETFGVGADGMEPLLKPAMGGSQPLHFFPPAGRTAGRQADLNGRQS